MPSSSRPLSSAAPSDHHIEPVPRPVARSRAVLPVAKPDPHNPESRPGNRDTNASPAPAAQVATLDRTHTMPNPASEDQARKTWIWRLAHRDYCDRNPSDCGIFNSKPLVSWQDNRDTINTAWREVWQSFWPAEDVGDTWGIGQDCEDYALMLRAELVRRGIPRYHMLMATGHSLTGPAKSHAVLIIRTDQGWKVADSFYPTILDRQSADRVFACRYMEDPDRGAWASCDENETPVFAGF